MSKKVIVIGIMVLFISPLLAAEDPGKALLDRLTLMFKNMAETGCGGEAEFMASLDQLMADAKKARDAKQIDAVFFRRYHRMLTVIRLMNIQDKEGILSPVVNEEIALFTEDVNGERLHSPSGAETIGAVADALANEIMNLHLYPDMVKMREKMRKNFDKQFEGSK